MNDLMPVVAGAVSTVIFAASALPMLMKAFRTKDLKSYSLPNIALSNVGNVIHSVYVYSLPPGPIWVLHGFFLVTTALMLLWYLRYELCRHTFECLNTLRFLTRRRSTVRSVESVTLAPLLAVHRVEPGP